MSDGAAERVRLDKWLWFARFYKRRPLATAAVSGGKVRVNGARQKKPGYGLKLGDVLTISRAGRGQVLSVKALGSRRGSAEEARLLYDEIGAPAETGKPETAPREPDRRGADAADDAPPATGA